MRRPGLWLCAALVSLPLALQAPSPWTVQAADLTFTITLPDDVLALARQIYARQGAPADDAHLTGYLAREMEERLHSLAQEMLRRTAAEATEAWERATPAQRQAIQEALEQARRAGAPR